jgi:hypothetical protein
MTAQTPSRRWRPTAVIVAVLALTIGAVASLPGVGEAAGKGAPVATGQPVISGTAQQGQTLTTSNGSWSDPPTNYTYQWFRCDATGGNCSEILNATSQTYLVVASDVGSTLRVEVVAGNLSGSGNTFSTATPIVSALPVVSKPVNVGLPAISGTVTVGSTLTASNGSWNGSPTSFGYAWSRCDTAGNNCSAISGATLVTYVLSQADVGSTMRVTVTATNAGGSASSASSATAVVPAVPVAPATGCPAGTGVVQVAAVTSPARLLLDSQTVNPRVVTPSAKTIEVHFLVTACGGRPVQGALVYATAVPYNQYSVPAEATTGADGTVNLTMTQLSGFPAARQQRLLVVFARARKAGEPLLGGISSRRLVSFPVSLNA